MEFWRFRVSAPSPARDFWRWPALLLWCLFFILGLWPELTFTMLREAGYVFSQNAIINSYNFISWCLTGFLAHFVYHRCLEADLPPLEALGKSFQLGVLGFVAFIDLPIEQIVHIRDAIDRALVLGTIGLKFLVWLYLYILIARYYWSRNPNIIATALPWLALTPAEPSTPPSPPRVAPTSEGETRPSVDNPANQVRE
jgi:hypothetical protein